MPKALIPSTQESATYRDFFTFEWFTYFSQLFTRVGGNKDYSLGGLLATDTTTVGNIGAGEDDLISYSLPRNTLGANNDILDITAFGTFADNTNNKTLKLYFGSVVYTTAVKKPRNTAWQITARVIRMTATTQKVIVSYSGEALANAINVFYTAATENLATAITIKCTGEAISTDDIVQQGFIIKNFPR